MPSQAQVDRYECLNGLFGALWLELKELEGRDPKEPLDPLKLKTAGQLTDAVRELLAAEPAAPFLHNLEESTSVGTAVVVLCQYRNAMEQFKTRYFGLDMGSYQNRWFTKEKP